MAYANKVAETKPKEDLKNPPDAKPDDWRNPWKGAAIGGTLGGLVTTALGYLYGHRGRWLAYDAIAGGGTGAAIGYGVDAHNNAKANSKVIETKTSGPSMEAHQARIKADREKRRVEHDEAVRQRAEVNARGGFWSRFAEMMNMLKGGHIKDFEEFEKTQEKNFNSIPMGGFGG